MQPSSITESPNELTDNIDLCSPEEIVRLLRGADAQVFSGYRNHPGLGDDEIIARILQAARWAGPIMGRDDAAIIISGAGTSGRLAMFAARTFNELLRRRKRHPNFRYLIAGTDLALIKAQEGAEDDPYQATQDLKPLTTGKKRVLYIGITCGLTAPYVANQLLQVSRKSANACVLIGFNPEDQARSLEFENWDKTFANVVQTIRRKPNCLILNPIVGPEPVTGSTRMKSGSATKILLEMVFGLAALETGLIRSPVARPFSGDTVRHWIRGYEQTREAVYERCADLGELVATGGQTLRRGGRIHYVGAGSAGILGLIDASECPPTFGADFDQVRGFLIHGWQTLLGPGRDLSDRGPWYRISTDEFLAEKAARLRRRDLVVALPWTGREQPILESLRQARNAGTATAIIRTNPRAIGSDASGIIVDVSRLPQTPAPGLPVFREYATKLALNAMTTGAFVLCGKVYRNLMVDLRISNDKLYHRAIGIIQRITGVSSQVARQALLRSIHHVDRVPPSLMRAKPSQHVQAATDVPKVIPKALIMAISRSTLADAEKALKKEVVVRTAIDRLKRASGRS